jgi:NagD protein
MVLRRRRPQLVRQDRPAARGRRDPLDPIWLIEAGARFIATNPDVTTPSVEGPLPATGSVAALITAATGRNPHSENTVMVGDRMDTDVVAGIEAGLDTILVFTGSTTVAAVEEYSYRPGRVLPSIAEAIDRI